MQKEDTDEQLYTCDGCQNWFHSDCIKGHKPSDDPDEEWYCDECAKQRCPKASAEPTHKRTDHDGDEGLSSPSHFKIIKLIGQVTSPPLYRPNISCIRTNQHLDELDIY